jgi:hypothetical protein
VFKKIDEVEATTIKDKSGINLKGAFFFIFD